MITSGQRVISHDPGLWAKLRRKLTSDVTSDTVIHAPAARVPAHLVSHPLSLPLRSFAEVPLTRGLHYRIPLACRRVFDTALGRRRAGRRRARFQRTDNVACDSRVRLKIRGPANLAGGHPVSSSVTFALVAATEAATSATSDVTTVPPPISPRYTPRYGEDGSKPEPAPPVPSPALWLMCPCTWVRCCLVFSLCYLEAC